MNYKEWLEKAFAFYQEMMGRENCRVRYVAPEIFGLNTYDVVLDFFYVAKMLEICKAITDRTTFEYIEDVENNRWYTIILHLDFFASQINWGSSIRGAWWDPGLKQNGDYKTDYEIASGDLKVPQDDWPLFLKALEEFVAEELAEYKKGEGHE